MLRGSDEAAKKGVTLKLRGLADVSNPFVPAVQPGAKLDWDIAKDDFASKLFELHSDYQGETKNVAFLRTNGTQLRSFETSGVKNPAGDANGLFLADRATRHRLSTSRVHLPWAEEKNPTAPLQLAEKPRTDVKGNWLRGRRLFSGEAGCATCHVIRGEGIAFGPDLSNLIFRDRDSVLNDILHPSATINPDHAGSLVHTTGGNSVAGIIRSFDQKKLVLALPAGLVSEFPAAEVRSTEPLKTSLMPEGFGEKITPEQVEDLLTYMLVQPLEAAVIVRTDPPAPPPRSMSEVMNVLPVGFANGSGEARPLRMLLCAGPKDHGLEEHDYPVWLDRWSRLLALADQVRVETSMGFPKLEQLARADVAVFYNANPGWDDQKAAALDDFHRRGAGAVYIHYAVDGGKDPAGVSERMGLAFSLGSRFRHGEMDLVFDSRDHPITHGLPRLHFTDETYWAMRGDLSRLTVLATADEDHAPRPQLWTLERHKSRIVGCIPGHYTWTFDDPLFRLLVLRSICWTAKDPNVDRLSELALIGARIAK